jgi:hypothetical protein
MNITAEIPLKSHQPNVLQESKVVDQKQKTIVTMPKKTSKLSTLKELKLIQLKDTSSLDETRNSPVSGLINEPVLINRQISQTDDRQNELLKPVLSRNWKQTWQLQLLPCLTKY